ncbi:helix-turn-helix transcriptional regulator [Aureimonas jatrophae]|jgi:LuxR family transcriptional regulator, quorum-sensing system regulator BjaR1|uniref:LuxR family transcriptional regulator, quorum sensing-dependent transcriptional regulator n=1 Tax=Aureimonas jatrophae TaxID=1166073 RepID=A0A1H0HW76_9HYPH|nr:LuxR family transcriptional regulator [Aureimonas jatrophae]MBB3950810.1 LuxR family quorum sensing-dependent transcriptional regulator [Aureimonas jatrophae]SDO23448.1 LuxR family transcriptional regulator, quorum sensing-dependent transcriptional regulator [Aureimonas jatrophae]
MSVHLPAFDFIERVKLHDSVEGVVSDLHGEASRVGIERLIVCGVPAPGQPFGPEILGSVWSPDWLQRYVERDYFPHDPVAQWAGRTTEPFRWSAVPGNGPWTAAANQFMGEAAEHGMVDGFVVPMFSPHEWQANVSFATSRPLDASSHDLAALHLMAIYATNRLRRLTGRLDEPPSLLTGREAECLTWIAAGKTVDDIATILGLSRLTIQTHLRNVRLKLNAATIAQAVAEGIRTGAVRI